MTDFAIRVYTPRSNAFTRSKRARRFWGSMGAALRCTVRQPDKVVQRRAATSRPLARAA